MRLTKLKITVEQLKSLTPQQQRALSDWFTSILDYEDDLVEVYIPEEEGFDSHGAVYKGTWDSEFEFHYPDNYIGSLNHHEGTILPLLTIDQMVDMLYGESFNPALFIPAFNALWGAVQYKLRGRDDTAT